MYPYCTLFSTHLNFVLVDYCSIEHFDLSRLTLNKLKFIGGWLHQTEISQGFVSDFCLIYFLIKFVFVGVFTFLPVTLISIPPKYYDL